MQDTSLLLAMMENPLVPFIPEFLVGKNLRKVEPEAMDLSFADGIDKREAFSLFNPKHATGAGELIRLFMEKRDVATLEKKAFYCRNRLNATLFQYALAVAMQHLEDTKEVMLPSIVVQFPAQFVDPSVFVKLREKDNERMWNNEPGEKDNDKSIVSEVDVNPVFTASGREEEQRMAYFREDVGANMHHWHWHLAYPNKVKEDVAGKDRRGELFYYMHSQIIARYNLERFCNKLKQVRHLTNFREPIPEAYFPKLYNPLKNVAIATREANRTMKDVNRGEWKVTVSEMECWRDRILMAINQGFLQKENGEKIMLNEESAIDVLGNVVESAPSTPNKNFYGDLHSMGHIMLAFIEDPENVHNTGPGAMGHVNTAMRDPLFYRWHGMVDGLLRRQKDLLTPYTIAQLGNPGVSMASVAVQTNNGQCQFNELNTFWQRSRIILNNGIPYKRKEDVYGIFTHLQHDPFSFHVKVNNESKEIKKGTLRIWIAPKVDESGTRLKFRQQRLFFVEMDRFTVTLKPGMNRIVRRSDQSSVTIPYERTYQPITKDLEQAEKLEKFCGCGWPQHLFVPKGNKQGVHYDLFAMVTDYADDAVEQELDPNAPCNDAHSFCGLRDKKYPDRRAMGYPFDRRVDESVETLKAFVARNCNMMINTITVKFKDIVIDSKGPEAIPGKVAKKD